MTTHEVLTLLRREPDAYVSIADDWAALHRQYGQHPITHFLSGKVGRELKAALRMGRDGRWRA